MQIFYTQPQIDIGLVEGHVDMSAAARAALARTQLRGNMPFVLLDDGRYDHDTSAFLRALPQVGVPAENSWRTYAHQVVLAAEWLLEHRGRASLLDATLEDLASYKTSRLDGGIRAVDKKTWNVQLAALEAFFDWAKRNGRIATLPFRSRKSHRRTTYGQFEVREVNSLYEDVPPEDVVRCLSLEEYEFFRDVGLRGGLPDGSQDAAFCARTHFRDSALAEVLVTTGMRITECLVMFCAELPASASDGRKTATARLGRRSTKGQKAREIIFSARVLREFVEPYRDIDRANAVVLGREAGRFGQHVALHHAVGWSAEGVRLATREGVELFSFDRFTPESRRGVYDVVDGEIREPAVLWCDERGLPLSDAAVRMAFNRANDRCNKNGAAESRFGRPMKATPHKLRHTFAVAYLNQLIREAGLNVRASREAGPDDHERQRRVLLDPLNELRIRLGHSSITTTFQYLTYLQDAKEMAFAAVERWSDLLARDGRA